MKPGRAPARLTVVGAVLAIIGALTVIGPLVDSYGMTRNEVMWNIGSGSLLFLTGLGLVFSARWAWPFAVLIAGAAVVLGLYTMAQPGDITMPGAFLVSFITEVVPGVLIAVALLTPRSLRWLRRQGEARDQDGPRSAEQRDRFFT